MPAHRVYVEPFSGGASMFFAKPLAELNVLGDTSPWLIPFYDQVRKGGLRSCKKGVPLSKKLYMRCLKQRTRHPSGKSACCRFALSALGFDGGQKMGFSTAEFHKGKRPGSLIRGAKLARLDQYERKLRKAAMHRRSFDQVMKSYDSPSTFFFLDPPWMVQSAKKYYEGNIGVTPQDVWRAASKMKGEVWVIYNMDPRVQKTFCGRRRKNGGGFKCYTLRTDRTGGRRGRKRYLKLLMSNRPIR